VFESYRNMGTYKTIYIGQFYLANFILVYCQVHGFV
jgi:hypothetical protein